MRPPSTFTQSPVYQQAYSNGYSSLIADGLPSSEASYYSAIQAKLQVLKSQGEQISLNGVTPYSQAEVNADPNLLHDGMNTLAPSAILTALQSPIYSQGMSDLKSLQQQNPGMSTYVVQYPGGSSITLAATPGSEKKIYLGPTVSSTSVKPQGYQSNTFGSGSSKSEGWDWSVEVTLSTPASYAQNSLVNIDYTASKFDVDDNIIPTQPVFTGYLPANVASGIIQVSNDSSGTSGVGIPGDDEEEAYNATIYNISGAVSLDGDGLGLSLNAGESWTQYAIFRLDGVSDTYYDVAATDD